MNKNDELLDTLYSGTSMSRHSEGLPHGWITGTADVDALNAQAYQEDLKRESFEDVTPDWAKNCMTVTPEECTIEKCTNGKFAVIDHSIQSIVAVADHIEGCYAFIHSLSTAYCPACGSRRMWDGGGWWCSCDDEREW